MRLLNRHWLVISYNYILELFLTSKTFLKFRKDTIYHSISFGKTKDRCLERILIASRIFFEEQDDSWKKSWTGREELESFHQRASVEWQSLEIPFSFSFFLPPSLPVSFTHGGEQETSHAGERVAYPVSRAILNTNFIKDFSSRAPLELLFI